jgi:hypothetical protein
MGDFSHLKAGDEVAVECGRSLRIATVDRVTPAGFIVIGGSTFKPNGYKRGDRGNWHLTRLCEMTPQIREQIEREELYGKVQLAGRRLDLVPTESLRIVAAELSKRLPKEGS